MSPSARSLLASTLATLELINQAASGRLAQDRAESRLDGATLVLERCGGSDTASVAAVDYARDRLNALLDHSRQSRFVMVSLRDGDMHQDDSASAQ